MKKLKKMKMENMIENEARKYIKDTLKKYFSEKNEVVYILDEKQNIKHESNDIDEITSKAMDEIRNGENGSYFVTVENEKISIDFLSLNLNCYKDYSVNEIFENKNISILDKYYIINKVVAC